ncbi:OmpA family protein [Vibrio navarrensis]
MKKQVDLRIKMKKTLPILVMVVLSNYAYANCVNTSEEQITTKTLLSTHYKTTQSEGTIVVDNSQTDERVLSKDIKTVQAKNSSEHCFFDEKKMSLVLNYQHNKAALTNIHQEAIKSYIGIADPNRKILVEGHADSTGSNDYNQRLSAKRANLVARYLQTDLGLGNRIVEKAFGESTPICAAEENRQNGCNRRVVLTLE